MIDYYRNNITSEPWESKRTFHPIIYIFRCPEMNKCQFILAELYKLNKLRS